MMELNLRRKENHIWILDWRKLSIIIFVLWLWTDNAFGQFSLSDSVPTTYPVDFRYQFPVNPGHPGLLAGTMGELRSTHFHAGIDIRTNNMIGAPVLTAQQGYV